MAQSQPASAAQAFRANAQRDAGDDEETVVRGWAAHVVDGALPAPDQRV